MSTPVPGKQNVDFSLVSRGRKEPALVVQFQVVFGRNGDHVDRGDFGQNFRNFRWRHANRMSQQPVFFDRQAPIAQRQMTFNASFNGITLD